MHTRKQVYQTGFTIIELMIATMIFSVILLTITYGVLSFTNAYYKGVNSSTNQTTARTITDTISQAIQFSGTTITPSKLDSNTGLSYFCTNNQVYTYRPGAQYGGGTPLSSSPGLYVVNSSICAPATFGGTELLGPHMRITALRVTPDTSSGLNQAYTISIRLAYSSGGAVGADGDDLLCSNAIASGPGSCVAGSANIPLTSYITDYSVDSAVGNAVVCRLQTGSQFCSVAGLTTTVLRRVATGQ